MSRVHRFTEDSNRKSDLQNDLQKVSTGRQVMKERMYRFGLIQEIEMVALGHDACLGRPDIVQYGAGRTSYGRKPQATGMLALTLTSSTGRTSNAKVVAVPELW